jgi:AcrR family transcriptional regulator
MSQQVDPQSAPADAGQPGRREERKAENRAKLLAAARKVFAEKGLGAATARDIVRETDLASGTFYNYFEDKNEVFRVLVEDFNDKARSAVREQRRLPGRTLEQRVEGAYRAYFELVVREPELFRAIMQNRRAAVVAEQELIETGVSELLEDLRDWLRAGDLPPVDLDYLAAAMVGSGVQIAARVIERDPPDIEAAARFCTRLFLAGIRALAEPD